MTVPGLDPRIVVEISTPERLRRDSSTSLPSFDPQIHSRARRTIRAFKPTGARIVAIRRKTGSTSGSLVWRRSAGRYERAGVHRRVERRLSWRRQRRAALPFASGGPAQFEGRWRPAHGNQLSPRETDRRSHLFGVDRHHG